MDTYTLRSTPFCAGVISPKCSFSVLDEKTGGWEGHTNRHPRVLPSIQQATSSLLVYWRWHYTTVLLPLLLVLCYPFVVVSFMWRVLATLTALRVVHPSACSSTLAVDRNAAGRFAYCTIFQFQENTAKMRCSFLHFSCGLCETYMKTFK